MLQAIQRLLGLRASASVESEHSGGFSAEARVAAVALLHRMAAADFETRDEEHAAVLLAIGRLLDEPPETAVRILDEAHSHAREAVSVFEFTRVLQRQLDSQQKEEVVELLWSVAFADGELDPQEEYLVRKVARLIHVSHESFLEAKARALAGRS
ncbi:MAG TPA: TerB family tellurite resistance protein [Thermoanaerobaculia bacterium]|nr:TerB family tellurite resistance protein [Thermoanaerobaculia bacterium]